MKYHFFYAIIDLSCILTTTLLCFVGLVLFITNDTIIVK